MTALDALLDFCARKVALEKGSELAPIQIYFSALFYRVNHSNLLCKQRDVEFAALYSIL